MVIFALNKVDDYRRRVISTFDFLRFTHEQQVVGLEVSSKTGYHVFDLFRMALLGMKIQSILQEKERERC
jgi:hypothetical protein